MGAYVFWLIFPMIWIVHSIALITPMMSVVTKLVGRSPRMCHCHAVFPVYGFTQCGCIFHLYSWCTPSSLHLLRYTWSTRHFMLLKGMWSWIHADTFYWTHLTPYKCPVTLVRSTSHHVVEFDHLYLQNISFFTTLHTIFWIFVFGVSFYTFSAIIVHYLWTSFVYLKSCIIFSMCI